MSKENKQLIFLDKAEQAIIQAKSIGELRGIMDKAEGIRHYAKVAKKGLIHQNHAAEIKILAERKAGEWLEKYGPKKGGDRKSKYQGSTLILKDMEVSRNESSRWREVHSLPEKDFKAHVAKINDAEQELTTAGVRKLAKELKFSKKIKQQREDIKTITPISGKFGLVVIDPPWPYGTDYDAAGRRVACPYPEMSIDQIAKIDIPADKDSSLWLWTTHKFLNDAFDLMQNWGFDYKATIVWDKESMGLGHWVRMQCEFCLLGIKGKPLWTAKNLRDIIREKKTDHSRKPKSFFDMINKNFDCSKLEYFSRETREGWTVYGDEIPREGG